MSESEKEATESAVAGEPGEPARGEDRRHERRYPVVGIGLLYSPFDGKVLEKAGQLVREAVAFDMSLSGLSFDVREPVAEGEELVIQVEDPGGGPAERVLAEVRWCQELDHAHYRIGTRIKEWAAGEPGTGGEPAAEALDAEALDAVSISRGPSVPAGGDFRCPACGKLTQFTLIGLQAGTWEKGDFPLYQCASCSSTRSMIAILGFNRRGF